MKTTKVLPNLFFFKFHKVGGSTVAALIKEMYSKTDDKAFVYYRGKKANVQTSEPSKSESVVPTTIQTTKDTSFLCLEHPCQQYFQHMIAEKIFGDDVDDSGSRNFFDNNDLKKKMNFPPNHHSHHDNTILLTVLREPISKFNSHFYYNKFLDYEFILNPHLNSHRDIRHKDLLSEPKLGKWQELKQLAPPLWHEDINAYIRRVYKVNKKMKSKLKKVINEYSAVLGGYTTVENAISMVRIYT